MESSIRAGRRMTQKPYVLKKRAGSWLRLLGRDNTQRGMLERAWREGGGHAQARPHLCVLAAFTGYSQRLPRPCHTPPPGRWGGRGREGGGVSYHRGEESDSPYVVLVWWDALVTVCVWWYDIMHSVIMQLLYLTQETSLWTWHLSLALKSMVSVLGLHYKSNPRSLRSIQSYSSQTR